MKRIWWFDFKDKSFGLRILSKKFYPHIYLFQHWNKGLVNTTLEGLRETRDMINKIIEQEEKKIKTKRKK